LSELKTSPEKQITVKFAVTLGRTQRRGQREPHF